MVAPQGFGYLGQALSGAGQYAAVYGAAHRPGTDRVACSPGHYVIAAYAAAETGLIEDSVLAGYGQNGSSLEAIGVTETARVVATMADATETAQAVAAMADVPGRSACGSSAAKSR
jgi:transketolase